MVNAKLSSEYYAGILLIKPLGTNFNEIVSASVSSQWRRYERDGVSSYRRLDCLINPLFRCRSKKISKFRVTGLCEGNPSVNGELPLHRASNTNVFSFDDVIMVENRKKALFWPFQWLYALTYAYRLATLTILPLPWQTHLVTLICKVRKYYRTEIMKIAWTEMIIETNFKRIRIPRENNCGTFILST